jgi:F-type H+-transporting ATPase subunit b
MIPSSVYYSIINFVIFVVLMVYVLRKPLRSFLQTRRDTFETMLAESQKAHQEAAAKLAEFEARLAKLDVEIAEMKRAAQEEGEKDRAAIIAQAKDFASKMKTDTSRMIAQELRASKELLKGTTIDLAIVLAERMLRQQLKPADHAKLVKGYIQKLEQLN